MKLFKSSLHFSKINQSILSFPTPFGKIYFDLMFNGKNLSEIKPTETQVGGETFISSWEISDCHIEFLRGNIIPRIPSHMKVENCIVGMWRIKNYNENLKVTFKTHLDMEHFSEVEKNSESGEGLICQSFENDVYKLSIGTEDEDFLNQRSQGKSMPIRLQNLIAPYMIECMAEGLQVDLPPFEKGEYFQIQFVVAWALKKFPDDSSWFAVEQSPSYILQFLGIED